MEELIKIFFAGIALGNGPCLFTCVPVILPYITVSPGIADDATPWRTGLKLTLIFSFSRVFAYSLLGFSAVIFYGFVFEILGTRGVYLRPLLGVIVFLVGIFYLFTIGRDTFLNGKLCSIIRSRFKDNSRMNMVLFGLLVGFSPCPPLLGMLTYIAATANNAVWGLASGFFFGLGTVITPLIPLGTLTGLAAGKIQRFSRLYVLLRILSALILAYFGARMAGVF